MKTHPVVRLWVILVVVFVSAEHPLGGGIEDLRQTGKVPSTVARAVSPSVVFIQVEGKASGSSISRFSSPFVVLSYTDPSGLAMGPPASSFRYAARPSQHWATLWLESRTTDLLNLKKYRLHVLRPLAANWSN